MSSAPPPSGAPISSAPIEPGRAPVGCARAGLIGCGVASLVVLVLVAVLLAYLRRNPATLTDLMMGQIERNFAPDVTAEDKEALRAAYAKFRRRLQDRSVGRQPIERLRTILSTAGRGAIGRERVRELTEVFDSAAAGPVTGESPRPSASPAHIPALSPTP